MRPIAAVLVLLLLMSSGILTTTAQDEYNETEDTYNFEDDYAESAEDIITINEACAVNNNAADFVKLSEPVEEPQRFMNGLELITFLESLGFNQSNCPSGVNAPPGSINIWNLNGNLAHSSVVLPGNRQIEMGRKPKEGDPTKYVSGILPAGENPSANVGEYELLGAWCSPPGSFVNMTYVKEMEGVDREMGEPDQWNCHGFSANIVASGVIFDQSMQEDQWVVWYAEKIGWRPIYITTYSRYRENEPSCSYSGGGLDCSVILEKTFILGPYSSKGEATTAICGQLTNFRRLRGIYAGLPVADYGGDLHNIENIGCSSP